MRLSSDFTTDHFHNAVKPSSGKRRCLALFCGLTLAAPAQILYQQDFNTNDTANWIVNNPGLSDILVDFFHDYSAIGVPSAPGGTGTRGMKMTANNSGGVFSGFSVSPAGVNLSGDYTLAFDWWANYVGPLGVGGSGSTQLSTFGIGTAGNVAVWPGAAVKESLFFACSLDGGSASDFRAYSTAAPLMYPSGNPVYQAPGGLVNDTAAYYGFFAPAAAPAAQVSLFPGQTGSTNTGEPSFRWVKAEIKVSGNLATWSLDGLPIATVNLTTVTLGGGNIFFGHSDTNAGSSSDSNDTLLNVTLIDNIVVSRPPATVLTIGRDGAALHFTWNTAPGKLYDLLSATELIEPTVQWLPWEGNENLSGGTLTIPVPADPRRFFALRIRNAP